MPVPNVDGLRPSKDFVRETLFNWLQPLLPGSCCLDLFAGTGALGFEAASRDAARVVMLDRSPLVIAKLKEQKAELGADQVEVQQIDALSYLRSCNIVFDSVFLDPPFASGLLQTCCELLFSSNCLNSHSRVYIESARQHGLPELPAGWGWSRQKQSGDVVFGLVEKTN